MMEGYGSVQISGSESWRPTGTGTLHYSESIHAKTFLVRPDTDPQHATNTYFGLQCGQTASVSTARGTLHPIQVIFFLVKAARAPTLLVITVLVLVCSPAIIHFVINSVFNPKLFGRIRILLIRSFRIGSRSYLLNFKV
jgi:hypothetical protein